jgi:hypothetical protein
MEAAARGHADRRSVCLHAKTKLDFGKIVFAEVEAE